MGNDQALVLLIDDIDAIVEELKANAGRGYMHGGKAA
jgi:hypothetical protein